MERLIKINSKILEKKQGVDQFAFQTIFKKLGVGKEYLVNDNWVDSLNGNQIPSEKRFSLSRENFRMARKTYKAWKLLSANDEIYDAVNKETIIQRIIDPQVSVWFEFMFGSAYGLGNEVNPFLTLFTPWGIRPNGSFGKPEIRVLDRIKIMRDELNSLLYGRIQVLLMPADVYATEINKVKKTFANKYIADLEKEGEKRNFEVKTWSSIRNENRQEYDELASKRDKNEIKKTLSASVIYSALNAAKNRSGRSSAIGIENAAFSYLRERICEADIIEKKYRPVKVSAVAKNKDNEVDRALPRVYTIPLEEQFPWLK